MTVDPWAFAFTPGISKDSYYLNSDRSVIGLGGAGRLVNKHGGPQVKGSKAMSFIIKSLFAGFFFFPKGILPKQMP